MKDKFITAIENVAREQFYSAYPKGYCPTMRNLLSDAVKKIDRRIKNSLDIVTQPFTDEEYAIGDEHPGIGDS